MSENKNIDNPNWEQLLDKSDTNIAVVSSAEVHSVSGCATTAKAHTHAITSSDRQIKFERAQKCLENAALVSKRIKEHRKATAELLGRPFEDDNEGDTASELASTMSERTSYSAATDVSTTMSVQEALNIPGISESLANTLKQKELLMEKIKHYKEISKKPVKKLTPTSRKESITDLKCKTGNESAGGTNLNAILKEKEKAITVIQVKMKAMETTILELQEKINEKDQIIEAKNKATALISDSMSKKEKDSLTLLEDTKQQMIKMQENFVTMESEWKQEKQTLLKEIQDKDLKINNLEEANTILENSRFEISLAHSKLAEEIDMKNAAIAELQEKIVNLTETQKVSDKQELVEEEKGSLEISNMVELTKKIELLEQINCHIRQTNKELESRLSSDPKTVVSGSPLKKGSPLPSRKGGRSTAAKMKSPWSKIDAPQDIDAKSNKSEISKLEMIIQCLNKDILEKEYMITQKDTLISDLTEMNSQKDLAITGLKEKQMERKSSHTEMVDMSVCTDALEPPNEPVKIAFSSDDDVNVMDLQNKLKEAGEEIKLLNNEIEAANKNMIKVKSQHKLKMKQMQKTIDNFSKVSDANAEIIKLNEELHQLSQKVAELEEEKGNLQLHLVDYDGGRLTESDIYRKMVEVESLAEARLKSITVLETQKFELVQELHDLQQKYVEIEDKLADAVHLQNEQVTTEIKSVQLEEQLDELIASKKELELIIENLKLDNEQFNRSIRLLQDEKEEINNKLQHYIQENIELTDKLEKLSAEKVSSAESIEIVESLTVQEKLELQEYNKNMSENKLGDDIHEENKPMSRCASDENIQKLVDESAELNRKIELFTQERQEVMEKMTRISEENDSLHEKITDLVSQSSVLQNNIEVLSNEKHEIMVLNEELVRQIDELKTKRLEVLKESVELVKPIAIEETIAEVSSIDQLDDKSAGDKNIKGAKSVKQLTKEILKLKNIIKERENEIADCQVKILALEEQHQKQNELIQSKTSYENKIKLISEENIQLKEELEILKKDKSSCDDQFKVNELFQAELHKIQHEYSNSIQIRDCRIKELETLLMEYEKQIINYNNTLQQKDKETVEYINQITKLNDVSQKLKSTIELLEEEKAKDQNAEVIKSLNKQISVYQKKNTEYDDKLRAYDEEKTQLLSLKNSLENQNTSLEKELKVLQAAFAEKQLILNELQLQQQKYKDEISAVIDQAKERDEEIHEIKLQLRKESIENEKLRTNLSQKDYSEEEYKQDVSNLNEKINQLTKEKDSLRENCISLETKNKELMEKLKKFAINIKKKSAINIELETRLHELENDLSSKNDYLQQLTIQLDSLSVLQDKLTHAEQELERLQSQNLLLAQQQTDIHNIQENNIILKGSLESAKTEICMLNDTLKIKHDHLNVSQEENQHLKNQLDTLSNRVAEYEIEQKNNLNLMTKISGLEADISKKDENISELLNKIDNMDQQYNQLQFGHAAKLQERDLFIESLETEISKYKTRICRLEDSISMMEDRRHSLERKADQLDNRLQEKQKAYSEYRSQEDDLVSRLAVLIDHDQVVEKQLHEIEIENKELLRKLQASNEDNERYRKSISDIQEYCNTLVEKASKMDSAEASIINYQTQIHELETNLKHVNNEYQLLTIKKKQDIDDLEVEFNTQIETAFKEKKTLSEKYEKISEYVTQLENKLQEYSANIQNLNVSHEELTRINQELNTKINNKEQVQMPDYTEQYISEINKLNSMLSSKNDEIIELRNKIKSVEANCLNIIGNLESKITQLNKELKKASSEIDDLVLEVSRLQESNDKLSNALSEKEEQIKQLMEKKKVTIEMNIPKTEGMVISSTIEPLSGGFDISSIESQIVSDDNTHQSHDKIIAKKVNDSKQTSLGEIETEPILVAKKAYLCYGQDENSQESDPYNSEEGWGFGVCEDTGDVTPGLSHLNNRIYELQNANDSLKADLNASNIKMLKVLKKLKELKANNDMLSNDLKISKQISHSSFLDTAIEYELKNRIEELEKKVEELNSEISKEHREKEAIRKQNEVFNNANEKLTDIKEKMDNEIELWKFKFKEANDKISTIEHRTGTKDSPENIVTAIKIKESGEQAREDIVKLEKENDELQSMLDRLTEESQELSREVKRLKEMNTQLTTTLQERNNKCDNCNILNERVDKLHNTNIDLQQENSSITKEINNLNLTIEENKSNNENLKQDNHNLQNQIKHYCSLVEENKLFNNELQIKCDKYSDDLKMTVEKYNMSIEECNQLKEELHNMKIVETENSSKISSLLSELETIKSDLNSYEENKSSIQEVSEFFALSEKYSLMEDNYQKLMKSLSEANNKITELETENQDLLHKIEIYDQKIVELNERLQNLNSENDQLLSTVAELRSSTSSAVDQRGFEIAELWKQHLAQREADFQKNEQELRCQITSYEQKYEELLDSIQSSSQEETNKLVMVEQVTSLQAKLKDKEDHIRNLQDKYGEVVSQIDILRSEMEDEKLMQENKFLSQQEEYEKHILELTNFNKNNTKDFETRLQYINTDLDVLKTKCDELNKFIGELQNTIKEKDKTISEMSNEILKKNAEIHEKSHEYSIALTVRNDEFEVVRKQLIDYEKKIEELIYEKESEVAIMRLKMHENGERHNNKVKESEAEKINLMEALDAKIIECTNYNKQITDLNKTLEEHVTKSIEMQTALENQEVEIVTLKDEIIALQEELRLSASKIVKHVTFASGTKTDTEAENIGEAFNKDLTDAVPRAELDLALYMLHQRDVRCEELTMELTHLLDERDTLQLRLSDSLRSYEELKSKCSSMGINTFVTSAEDKLTELPTLPVDKEQHFIDVHRPQTSRSSSISETDGDKPKLQAKLSELRSVKHSRDVRFRQASEQRQLDLRLLQRDVANLPPEAAAQLAAQAHHTLSRDAQSTSTVLLNWLRGKSTPKIVHDM